MCFRCSSPLVALTLALLCVVVPASAQAPQSPEEFLGHRVGADYKLVPWPRIVEYFDHLAANSSRINLRRLGDTTEGRPFLFAEISSEETIANIDTHKAAQRKIADPRLIANDDERKRLIDETKIPIVVNCQIHSSETAASQMSMELAYDLLTGDDDATKEILDHCIILLIPCANPDGQAMVAEWYERSIDTPWEGTGGMPWIYQKYAGHDNNRDWFMLNLQETRLTTQMLYKEWFPTIVWDVHQMGNSGARLFVPPFFDPKNYNVHPVIDQTLLIIGGHMSGDLAREGMKGVVWGAMYDNWWAGGFRTTPYRHNMIGILTEAASVNGASPVFQRKSQLRGGRRGMPRYDIATNFPDPWPGGWWRLRDIVDYEKTIATSLFTLASRYHGRFQENYVHFGEEAIAKGKNEPPFAWLVPPNQHDPRSAYEMLERLDATAVEVHEALDSFTADGVEYPEGTSILYTAQPYRPHLMDMMERQVYPDREVYPGGPAEAPYDMAGWTMPLQMGVEHVEIDGAFEVRSRKLDGLSVPQGKVISESSDNFIVLPGNNDNYRLLNRLHKAGVSVKVAHQAIATNSEDLASPLPPGTLLITPTRQQREALSKAHEGLSIDLVGIESLKGGVEESFFHDAPAPRMALYQPWTASMDEGWTRLALDNFEYEYTNLHNAEVRAGNLNQRYDCILLPSVYAQQIIDGRSVDSTAPEYAGGIGDKGIVALQDFVEAGGTLVCIDQSTNFAIDHFNIPVTNIVRGLKTNDFYCPGSILRLNIDTTHPLGYGMPEWYSGYFARSQAFQVTTKNGDDGNHDPGRTPAERFPVKVVSRYSDTVLLQSGWIRGGELIADKPAIVEIEYGEGRLDLLGFGVQRRGQPHGTFRIMFNAIQGSTLPR